jgi:hypothetical protein
MELQALAGQLYIVEGVVQEGTAAPGLVAQRAPRKVARGREQDFLFVHLTLERPNAEIYTLIQELTEALVTTYYQQTGGITTALRHAIGHINEHLLRWNVSSAGHSRDGSLTCAVLRDDALVVAQVGSAVAFIGRNFGVERIPADEPERVAPLGRTASLNVRMGHYRLQPGDMLLLSDPVLGVLPTAAVQPALVDTEVLLGLQELTDMVGLGSGRLLLVEFSDEAPAELSEMGIMPARSSTSTLLANTPPTPLPQREGEPRPPLPETARHATAQAARGLSRFTGGVASMMRTLRPPRDPAEPPLNTPLYATLAILIPLIMAAVITSVFFQRGQVAEFAQLRQEIGLAVQEAQSADDVATQRTYYNQVLLLAARAEALRPLDAGIASQRNVAMNALDRLDGITRLNGTLLYAYPETSNLTAVIIRPPYGLNGDIFVLDEGQNRVLRHASDPLTLALTAEQPETILFGGQVVQSHTVGKLTDLLWRPRGSAVTRDGVAILDSRGQLISYYTNFGETRATPFGLASQWRTPVSMKGFSERVYVLDPTAEQIWRYYSDGDALQIQDAAPAIEFVDPANLSLATDFAINQQDGSVLILYGDGHLRRFANGRTIWTEQELLDSGLASPLLGPTAIKIAGQGLNSSVFVLDPPSGRLLQLSLGGTLLAQYRIRTADGLELLTRATDFAVTEEPLRIFITTPQGLYVATLN